MLIAQAFNLNGAKMIVGGKSPRRPIEVVIKKLAVEKAKLKIASQIKLVVEGDNAIPMNATSG